MTAAPACVVEHPDPDEREDGDPIWTENGGHRIRMSTLSDERLLRALHVYHHEEEYDNSTDDPHPDDAYVRYLKRELKRRHHLLPKVIELRLVGAL